MKRIINSFRAGFTIYKLAFILIATLLLMILASAIFPQRDIVENRMINWQSLLGNNYEIIEKLGLDRIYYSPLFFITLGLLAITIIAGNIKRFKLIYKTEKTLFRLKHLGSVIFHISIIIVILGVILNFLYKYTGIYSLTEGQNAHDRPDYYFREISGPLYNGIYDRFEIQLNEVIPEFRVGDNYAQAGAIAIYPAMSKIPIIDTIMTNRPLKWNNLEFHYGPKTGYSPELLILENDNEVFFRSFIRLANTKVDNNFIDYDFIELPDGLKVGIEVINYPDEAESNDFNITVEKNGELIYDNNVVMKDTISVLDKRISIQRMRRWCYIDVIYSPYLNIVFFGFWSVLTGLALGLIARIAGK